MEELLELAQRVADKVEVYGDEEDVEEVTFENGRLKNIESALRSGVALTLIRDGKLGFAYTRHLTDPTRLIENALASMVGNVEADYELAGPHTPPTLASYDPVMEELTADVLVAECERLCGALSGDNRQVDAQALRSMTTVRVLTSAGFAGEARLSHFASAVQIAYPGTRSGLYESWRAKRFEPAPDAELASLAQTYEHSLPEVRLPSGRVRVLFTPQALYALFWRLSAGLRAKEVYEGISPLKDRLGERIASSLLTVEDRPLDDRWPGARAFDDEGTPCSDRRLIDHGRLTSFYADRFYAWKLGMAPTGHGYRDDVAQRVSPQLRHLHLQPGAHTFVDLLRLMDHGVVVVSILGAHSGNIVHGDFSIGLSPGLVVRDGEVVGHVKDAMLAGNAYDLLDRVVAVGREVKPVPMGGWSPALLVEDVSFACR